MRKGAREVKMYKDGYARPRIKTDLEESEDKERVNDGEKRYSMGCEYRDVRNCWRCWR